MSKSICIIGAGLSGTLLAIYLAKRGYQVAVYEKRPDMRVVAQSAGRSINLALSRRGILALERVGIAEEVLAEAIPMYGRMLHALDGSLTHVPYGKDQTEYINSVSRWGLNVALLNAAAAQPNIALHFEMELQSVDFERDTLQFICLRDGTSHTLSAERVLAADGAGSALRHAMVAANITQDSIEWLAHGYKELSIPAQAGGAWAMEKNALHIWPRGAYMLIALPNPDGTFTGTLFFPHQGANSFEELNTPARIHAFFAEQFGDTLALMPRLVADFQHNPVGLLGTTRCMPWHYDNRYLLLGDAAHAIVPFYGQGMNASFEDVRVLDELLTQYHDNWAEVMPAFTAARKPNTDAIAALAVENFYEMRDGTADPAFLRKRKLETLIEHQFPDYHSKYSLVTFHPEVPYSEAHRRGNAQDDFLLDFCRQHIELSQIDLNALYGQLRAL